MSGVGRRSEVRSPRSKQTRPRPATWAALLVITPCLPFRCADAFPKERHPSPHSAAQSAAQSCSVRRTLCEGRNARVSTRAEARFSPSSSSPSRTAGNRQLCRSLRQALRTSHVCTASTLRQDRRARNYKYGRLCAEAVDDPTSLWKQPENAAGFSPAETENPAAAARAILSEANDPTLHALSPRAS